MIRRIISCLLIVTLFLAMIPNTVYAQEIDQRYTQDQMDTIVQRYDYNEDMLNSLFCVDTAVGYWGMANNIKQNGVLAWALDMSSRLIGEYPEKQDYAEMLANLITMQTGELAEQIETQSRFDDLKDVGDYAWDVIEIAAAFVGASGALETISAAIDTGVSGVGDVIIKNNEQAKYYEVTLQEYSQSDAFLHAISKNAENEELRNVAASLLRANDTLLVKRLEYLADAGANIAEYEAEFFIKNMSMELLKEADLYVTDETVKFFVDEGISLKNAILAATDAAKFAFKMVILAGDIGFGTSDVYNRYQEMKAVADIAASLVKANKDIHVPSENTQETLEVIQGKCNLYKALIVTHARGEYLLYQLLMNDAGAISDIRWIIEYFKNPEETTEAWYDGQIEVLTKYCNILDEMFVLPQKEAATAYPLSQVNAYYTDGLLWYRYDFTYNDACQLTTVCNSTDPANQVIWKYSYDDIGHLVRVEQTMSGNVSTMKEYVYDETGLLNRWYVNDVYGGTEYACVYDEQNRRIQTVGKNAEETIVTKCEYNSDGLLEQQNSTYTSNSTGESYSTLSQFDYDADGRIVYNHIDAGSNTYQYTYRYDLGPLCICQDARGTYILILYDEMNSEIWEMDAAAGELVVDEAGRLTRIQCDGFYYEFLYKDSFSRESTSLSQDDRHSLNVFLSYFSQQWFNEVNPTTYEVKTDPFDVQNADPAQLIYFVDLYTKINNGQVWYDSLDQDSKVHLSLDYVNGKLQQFFGVSILAQDVQKSGYELRDGNIYFDFAMGETYNYMTVVRSCEELSNGTVSAEFDIYRGEGKYRYAGGPIIVEDVYWYSTEDAQQDADLIYYKSGTATVRQTGNGNDAIYQLIQYALEGQTENMEKLSFDDIPDEYTFTSGAGGWSTGLKIGTDGYFEGQYHDSNMGETGDGYPKGTVYYCNFSGKFSEPESVNEYTYRVSLEQFSVADQTGVEYLENEIKYIASDPYGFDGPDEYYIYLPGVPSSMMPQSAFDWVSRLYGNNFGSYEVYVICSANGELPFVGEFK